VTFLKQHEEEKPVVSFVCRAVVGSDSTMASTWFSVASPFCEEEEREEKLPVMAARGRRKRALGFGAA
jgi:hypothetical protein